MIIINQDREELTAFEKDDILESKAIINGGVLYGINLILNDVILGTYDNMKSVIVEMNNIINCEYNYYIINGFSDYKGNFN